MSFPRPAAVVVLAAGEGVRMRSSRPKVLHTIGGRSLLAHAVAAARGLEPAHLAVVVRHQRDQVAEHVAQIDPSAIIADQDEVKGTARAVECSLACLPPDLEGTVVVTCGDVPLLSSQTLQAMLQAHHEDASSVTVITAAVPDPTGYGRIVRDGGGTVAAIVEQKDATEAQRAIREINSGLYAFEVGALRAALAEVDSANAQGERYLTDVLAISRRRGHRVGAFVVDDVWQTEGVNDKVQLARLGAELNRRTVEQAMRDGALVHDPATTWIDATVSIGQDTVVHPNTQLLGATTIGADAVIGPDTTLQDMEVGDGATVCRTQGSLSVIGAGATVGPWAYLRPGTELGAEGKIGTFVETKNASLGPGAKVPHLSYVGDATIGEGTNIGAASVFVNYDGMAKHRTVVGRHCRMGSDNMYVAPLTVGDGVYSGAGTVLRQDVPSGSLAVNVVPQRNTPGWVLANRPGTRAAAAAQEAGAPDDPPSWATTGPAAQRAHSAEAGGVPADPLASVTAQPNPRVVQSAERTGVLGGRHTEEPDGTSDG